ncbi:MAG: sensor histidine kinase [Lachnospiraceae bacterium]
MRASIRYRFTLIFISLMAAMLLAIWAVNNLLLENYYISKKLKVMEAAYTILDTVVMEKIKAGEDIGDVITNEAEREWSNWNWNIKQNDAPHQGGGKTPRSSDEAFPPEPQSKTPEEMLVDESSLIYTIREYGEKDNLAIVMIDSSTGKSLLSSAREGEWLVQKVNRYILGGRTKQEEVLAVHDNYTVEKNYDPRTQSYNIECWGFFSDNSTLFIMSMPISSIRDSVALSNRFTTYAGLSVLVMASIVMYFVTMRVTKPIKKLAELSERMSHLDFDASYEGDARDEIGILGRSMNTLSDKLKETIGELQAANGQLQKDIEEKIEIDEMRQRFIADVSHELKTPIALIQGYAEGLTEGMCKDEESRDYYCEVIVDEANKMNKMVKQLLTLSALEYGSDMPLMESFDLTELIRDLLNSARILFEQNEAQVTFEDTEPVYVRGDEFKIEEVLTNYLNNAMNHLNGKRQIKVRMERGEDEVRVCVYNDGNPVPDEDIPNLWTKFYKVDKARTRTYGGSGIGLSIVKAVIDAHHKECGVENVDDGVEFWFTLDIKK